ncbi:MAG: glycogen synthase GlgA [Thiotrichales bacterium]
MNVLFVASEAYPLIKTGGLADVVGHLPIALNQEGAEVTVAIPAYGRVLEQYPGAVIAAVETWSGYALVRETYLPQSGLRVWMIDHPYFSSRHENPYVNKAGDEWPDNGQAFALFSLVIAKILAEEVKLRADFDLVHCHDWQTGLVPVYLHERGSPVPVVFTIHNIAYQGVYPALLRHEIQLPEDTWHMSGVEFYSQLSFMKGGIVYADRITTVSPSYAEEIKTDEFAYGLAGLLNARADVLSGIINGIDTTVWHPATDALIPRNYDAGTLDLKKDNKLVLQRTLGLERNPDALVLGNVGRMVDQKGIDIILYAIELLLDIPVQFAIVGTGEPYYEHRTHEAVKAYPGKVGALVGYDEETAHLVEAGADVFLMPSRFEPCGLNQMYSQTYGTLPIVNPTGGLRDTVENIEESTLDQGIGTGYFLDYLGPDDLARKVRKAYELFQSPERWHQAQTNAMSRDFSWTNSARQYVDLYRTLSRSEE